jgi:hypothetical protein
MTKATITEQINSIAYESITEEQFAFLKERALKSVRKPAENRKPTKNQQENAEIADKLVAYIEENGLVTCSQVEAMYGISNQRASAILNKSGRFTKVTPAKGKEKAKFGIAD